MASRPNRARSHFKTEILGGPQLTLAQFIITLENILRIFARPLMLAGGFVALAWLGVFNSLYPWVHLAVLAFFVLLFFQALGRARLEWKPVPFSAAKRRVEDASGLQHRPLDVLDDRPVTLNSEQISLWQAHVGRAREQVKNLRWPRWKASFADRDPYALRYALLVLLVIGAVSGWGALGGRLITAINPALGKLHLLSPTIDAWITPPEYTHLPPMMIATPAGVRHDGDVIEVPEGSTITAHIADKTTDVPDLAVNGATTPFTVDDHQDFGASAVIHSGDKIAIRRGWQDLGSWKIRVVPDHAPQIALTEQPTASERKALRISYKATDDYGVTSIAMRVMPKESLPGVSSDPIDMGLAEPDAQSVERVSYEDLTSHPWAGLPVQIQLIATDATGHKTETAPVDFVLPERIFFNPLARALVEERKKILQDPDNDAVRNEVANVMAGIAHQPASYHGDPVVLMALRSGAVRLVLDRGHEAVAPTTDVLWRTAVRIEDGSTGLAEQNLREAQRELADALDRNASEQEIQQLIDKLHQALNQYLSELATRVAARPGPTEDLSQLLGTQTNMLSPKDLDQMLEQMRNMSATGARDAARAELQKMQQLLESMRTDHPQFTEEQKRDIQRLHALRELTQQQQKLLDKTFQNAQGTDKTPHGKLLSEQNELLRKLQGLMGAADKKADNLAKGADAMKGAGSDLQEGQTQGAVKYQGQAVEALQQAMQDLANDLRSGMMMLPLPGMGMAGNRDPFGRGFSGLLRDDDGIKVPDQMEVRRVREILNELQRRAGDSDRPKAERDYIERLLQNF